MKDELTHIQVLKVDEEGDPFAGNELAIVDGDGNIIEQWTSTEEAHDVYGLIGGDTYTLKEIAPVKGYRTADPIEFTVPTTNEGFVITMQNEKIRSHIDVLKVDYYDRERALPFAEFTMYADEDCTQVIDVQRGGKDGLARFEDVAYGSTVYIKETDAPVGYRLSDEVVKVTIDEEWISGDHTRVIVYPDMPLPESGGNTGTGNDAGVWMLIALGSLTGIYLLARRRKDHV